MKRILLVCLTAVFALASSAVWAQERTVTGRVTSAEDGSGLPGVNVVLKGTTNGTVTDANGSYTLKVPAEGGILMITFIGLTTQEIEIGSRSTVDVPMAADTKQLTEVVVTAFGIEKDKKSLGYAVQDVSGSALTTARESNIVNSLSGRVAGVQVTNGSGSVGSSSRIVLRGASSLTGNNQPLFVVDGIPINNNNYATGIGNTVVNGNGGADRQNGAADINPDDVESVTVLPGPNAAALYGSRASNGVILITTKSGRGSKGLGISVNSSATFEKPLRLPSYQNSYGGGYNNKYYNWHDGTTDSGGEDESWGPALDKGLEFVQWDSFDGQPRPWVSHPDNIKDFFETGKTFQNNIALSGGNEKADFRLSLSNFDQKGIIPNNDFKKNTIAISSGLNVTDKFRAEVSVNYIKSKSDNTTGGGYDNNNPMQQFTWFQRNVDVQKLKDYANLPLAPEGTSAAGTPINWNTNFNNNPYWVLYNNTQGFDKDRIIGNVRLSYEFTDWLSLSVRTGTDFFTDLAVSKRAHGSNDYPNGNYQEVDRTWYEVNSDFLLTFNKEVMTDLKVVASVGGNNMRQVHDRTIAEAPELEIPGVYNLDNSRVAVDVETFAEQKEIHSLYGNVELSFRDYLFLTVTGRNDWSSTLPKNNNSYFYPSFSLSADVTSILGLQSEVLSYAKIRGGWAQVGADTDPYKLVNVYSFFDPWGGSLITPTVGNTLLNPNLKPEISSSYELGTELGLFGNAVNLTFTYYNKTSTDQIVPVSISGASGYTSFQVNAGEMTNKGIELQVSGSPIKTSTGFTWDVSANFTRNRNEVVKLAPGLEALQLSSYWNSQIIAQRGQPYGVIYGTDYLRDPQGNIVHVNGVPQRDPSGNKTLGDANPDWLAGLNNTFSYKGLSLNVLVDAKIGGEVYSMTNAWGRYSGILEETLIGRETGIIGKGVKQAGTDENGDPIYVPNDVSVPAMTYNHAAFGNTVVAGSVFDASYVKLRQVSLGYTLPASLLTKTPFKKVTFSIIGRNLALLYTKVPHIDPETGFTNSNGNLGLEHAQTPSTRSMGFNLNFTL
ncbi:SusC/RagA family TonB-linked outer membrane protein [Parachryseolinea silvisoli]|uniref:SusC/RagA family TonB-linked outer membrane protein n=1 Tax=Parachryseolinea silvisoli TaxID=2873601 RepID=UPI002265966A|nr:SusC/RagA family TonB-linked outer membrane protein [Parachryseolinea silvisoli]MCD9019321.1 SusC/RagA family TonB-linked outer membrane protein [Parachryseolinea silvisoli]